MAVAAVEGGLAARTAEDRLRRSVVARNVDGLRLAGHDLDPVGLDKEVDDERATCLALAVQAVAAVDEERLARQPIAHRTARTATFADHGAEPNRTRVRRFLGRLDSESRT